MGGKFEAGHIRGIPLVIDGSFLILIVLWGMPWFRTGSAADMAFGLWLVVGLAGSIILHELGHAWAGQYYGVRTSHLELNGLGGLCYYASSMPMKPFPRIVMLLAGPAANLLLWGLFAGAGHLLTGFKPPSWLPVTGFARLEYLCTMLAWMNGWMLCFNLLPAYPLDGGRTLEAILRLWTHVDRARYIVGWLGLVVTVGCVFSVPLYGLFMLVLVLHLYQANAFVLASSGGPKWKRWS